MTKFSRIDSTPDQLKITYAFEAAHTIIDELSRSFYWGEMTDGAKYENAVDFAERYAAVRPDDVTGLMTRVALSRPYLNWMSAAQTREFMARVRTAAGIAQPPFMSLKTPEEYRDGYQPRPQGFR